MMHCRHRHQDPVPPTSDEDDEGDDAKSSGHVHTTKKSRRGLDISIKFFDSFSRTMDAVKRSLDAMKENYKTQDEAVNFGVGYVEDKKLTHGISPGGVTSGIYGGRDLLYNPKTEEYLVCTKSGTILKFDWTGTKQGAVNTSKRFSRFIHIECTGMYMCYNPGKTFYYVFREDWTLCLDTVSIMPIDKIISNGRKSEESNFDFFILSGCTVNRFSYSPANNLVMLQDSLKMSDIEAEGAEIEQTCFDEPVEDKKQWIYLTFKNNCTTIDIQGRVLGSKKNLHPHKITAIVAYGPSEFVVTGDEKGNLKIWGPRWQIMTEVSPHNDRVTHLLEHPNGRAIVSFSPDQQLFAFSLDTQRKLESMKTPEIVEHIAVNKARKAFMALGPRKLTIFKMDVLFFPFAPMSSALAFCDFTWNPDIPKRIVAVSTDNAIRVINPVTGRILKSVLVNPPKPTLNGVVYAPHLETMYVLKTSPEDVNSLCVQIFDCTLNPCKYKETWEENKWDAGVTAMALYDYHANIVVPEKTLTFSLSLKKKEETQVSYEIDKTFLICGLRDGCVCMLNMNTGDCEYKTSCHKGQVNKIEVNFELNQFVSLGAEPSVRIWKVSLRSDEVFIPLFDISWKYAIRQVAVIRDVISFALSHHDSPTHKVVFFNTSETERYDHRNYFSHSKEIICLSGCRELLLFMSASSDETIRIWNEKAELVRLLMLNWKPTWAGFGTSQGDIFIGIENKLQVIPANKILSVIYRNRALLSGLNAGGQEMPTPLNATRSSQDPRMYVVLEEEERYDQKQREQEKEREKERKMHPRSSKDKGKKNIFVMEEKIPKIEVYTEPKDSQRSKDLEKYRMLEEDLAQIVEGNHNFSIYVPDFKKMTKKQLDEYGKTIFPEDGDKRKLFASESRVAAKIAMEQNAKAISASDDYTI